MRSAILLSVASAILITGIEAQSTTTPVTGILGNASVVSRNPVGPIYTAVLPTTEFFNPHDPRGNVKGSISATASPNGVGVSFQVNFSNLPTSGGPFLYHLHVLPVNSSGSCASTLAHLDPFIRGEKPACDPTLPATCQVGDMSGKHGKITSDPFSASFVDPYASTVNGLGSFFGNRSFVIHFANTTRITCANFALVPGSASASNTTKTKATATGQPVLFPGSANSVSVSMLAVFAAVFATFLL